MIAKAIAGLVPLLPAVGLPRPQAAFVDRHHPLAAVEVKTLFTVLCYLTSGTEAMPRDALDALATEATSAAAAIVNRIAGT